MCSLIHNMHVQVEICLLGRLWLKVKSTPGLLGYSVTVTVEVLLLTIDVYHCIRGILQQPVSTPLSLEHIIVYQSAKDLIVRSFKEPLPIYCISTHHATATYRWRKLGEPDKRFPYTAVIYVNEIGIYQCSVTCEREQTTIESVAVSVSVQPGIKIIVQCTVL